MKIVVATVTAGAGHLQAATAVEEWWREERPADLVERIDLLDLVPRLQRKLYVEGYVKLVEHAPGLWGMVFQKTDNAALVRRLARFRHRFARRSNERFARHLKVTRPDVVIATHYLPVEVVGGLRTRVAGWSPFLACVITDFEAHALWMDDAVDLYCVAAPETGESLVARGVESGRIAVTGIPVSGRFAAPPESRAARKQFGLRDDVPVLLVLGGGFGMGPVAEMLRSLDRVERPLQVVVVAGRNEALRRELACADVHHPTRVLGFVGNMHEWMSASDLILTKPGGLTTSEALALGRPLLIFNPIPGQEAANSDFLLQQGVAAKVTRVEEIPGRVEALLGSRKLREMARRATRLGRPLAARDICGRILERVERR